MTIEEPSLPRLPAVSWDEQSQSITNNPRKRVRGQNTKHASSTAFNSSDPAIFSSDDDPALDNYVEGRRKKRYVGSWFQQHPTSSDSTFGDAVQTPKQRRPWTRQADSGVFLGSDGNESDGITDLEITPKARLPAPILDRAVHRVSEPEQLARDKVQSCLEHGNETVDLWSMGIENISNDTISPLSQFTCIPLVTKDVAFEQKDPELKMYLAMNRLTRVPGAIFDLTHLTILSLRGNKLTELPPAVAKLTHLKELNVSQNRLRSLPAELLDLFAHGNNLHTLVVHPNPFWQPGEDFNVQVSEDGDEDEDEDEDQSNEGQPNENQPNKALLYTYAGLTSAAIPHLVSRSLGRSPLQLSDTAGRISSDFRFPIDYRARILAVESSDAASSSSSLASGESRNSVTGASRVPSLLETALRACYRSAQLPEMRDYIPEGLSHLRKLLERAQQLKEIGGLSCSRCKTPMVVPTVEWVEWRDVRTCQLVKNETPCQARVVPLSMAEGERTVPFVHRGCSWRCGPEQEKQGWGVPDGYPSPTNIEETETF